VNISIDNGVSGVHAEVLVKGKMTNGVSKNFRQWHHRRSRITLITEGKLKVNFANVDSI